MNAEEIAQTILDRHDFAALSDLKSPEQVFDMIVEAIQVAQLRTP